MSERLDLLRRLGVMRVGGPTADGRSHFNGSLSNEEWIALQDALTKTPAEVLAEMGGKRVWWCIAHDSRINEVLDGTDSPPVWGGCHSSLWAFASGMGNGGKEDNVGRCDWVKVWIVKEADHE